MAFLISRGVQITPTTEYCQPFTVMPMLKTITVSFISVLSYITIFKINYIDILQFVAILGL